jgi:hypothetical protein
MPIWWNQVDTVDLSPAALARESSNLSIGTKRLSLTLNDRGLGFELNGVSLILTGIAKFVSMVKQAYTTSLIRWCIDS